MNFPTINVGDTLTCAETGKTFVAARDGCSMNYARSRDGAVISDEGVDIREKRALLDRSQPFNCYISSDGKHATGWKGNVLGTVISATRTALPFGRTFSDWHGKDYTAYQVRDVHGGIWHGKGSPGVCITLRAAKPAKPTVRSAERAAEASWLAGMGV